MSRLRLALVALALAGCNPNDFGSTMDRAPVQFIGRPDDFGSNGGRVLLPLPPPVDNPKAAGRLLLAGTDNPSLAVADFDGDGKPSVEVISDDELITIGVTAGITSMVSLPGSGTLVLGMGEHVVVPGEFVSLGSVAFVRLVANSEGELSLANVARSTDGNGSMGGHFGLAVARGQVTQAIDEEVVAVADNGVSVLNSGGLELASAVCAGGFKTPTDLYRSLAVADFRAGGQQEIAMGFPIAGGVGRVVILQYGMNPDAALPVPELFCPVTLHAPDVGIPAVSGFGASLAAVPDQDSDGLAELLVGAPPDRAYLFYSTGAPPLVIKSETPTEFGQRVALVDIDRDGIPELGISALQANAGKTLRAGAVYFYKLNGTRVAELFDSNAVANKEFFGIGLAGMEFNSNRVCAEGIAAQIPVVGADKGVFAFFRFDDKTADPRCFAR